MSDELIVEHAVEMSGGGMHVRWEGAEKEYPLSQWIPAKRRCGGKVYRRKILVVEDWVEVSSDD